MPAVDADSIEVIVERGTLTIGAERTPHHASAQAEHGGRTRYHAMTSDVGSV